MRWKYYIPHVWESELDRTTWEDIYLMPDIHGYAGPSVWLTIGALGDTSEPEQDPCMADFQAKALVSLGSSDFWIKDADMTVRAMDFNLEEFLQWTRIWLQARGFEVSELISVNAEEFEGTNQHASIVSTLAEEIKRDHDKRGS